MKPLFQKSSVLRRATIVDLFAIISACVVYLILVLPGISQFSTYFDEGYSAYLARFDVFTIAQYTALDVHPPLYYALLHLWQNIFGSGVVELRSLSLLFGWGVIIFTYLLLRRLFDQKTALLGVLLLAMSPLFVRYGSSMRMYTMALYFVMAATYVLQVAIKHKKNKKWWGIYALLVAAGMWTNYFTALAWVSHAVWLLYEHRKQGEIVASWRWSLFVAVLLYLPWLPMMLFRYGEIQANGFWIKPVSIDTIGSTITQSIVFHNASETKTWIAMGLAILVGTVCVYGRRVYRQISDEQKRSLRLMLIMSFLPILLLFIGSLPPLRSSYVYRYVLVSAVFATMLIAIIVRFSSFKKNSLFKYGALIVLTIGMFLYGSIEVTRTGGRNLDTNVQNKLGQVITNIQQSNKPATIILRSPYSYYASRLYSSSDFPIKFTYGRNLANVGSTRPLFDHPNEAINDFDSLDKLWLVGEDRSSVRKPGVGHWKEKDSRTEYDDITKKAVAFATYYEREK